MKSQFLLLAVLVGGCAMARADVPQASEPRKTPEFHGIDIRGTIGVEARIGALSVEVRGDAGRLKDVSTTVEDGVLVINTPRSMKNVKHLHVIVSAPALDVLRISGTGQIDATGIAAAKLDLDISGTGQLSVAGTATEVTVRIAGTGALKASKLATETTRVRIEGTGEASLHATRTLELEVTGTAAINVSGKPQIKKRVSGTISLNER
ncbi:MAG: head GIN domain-containing protein [Kofleriaceae bacterium]